MSEQVKNTSKWFKENVKCCYNCQNWYRGEWDELTNSRYNYCKIIGKDWLSAWDNYCKSYDGCAKLSNELEGTIDERTD